MVGPWSLAPHHDHLQYIHHHVHLMQRGQNQGVTFLAPFVILRAISSFILLEASSSWSFGFGLLLLLPLTPKVFPFKCLLKESML